MPQSDGRNQLKRMEFEYKGRTFRFAINPEEYTQDEPNRSTTTQTLGGAWIDFFGAGLPIIFMKGHTGYDNGRGVERFKAFRKIIRDYYDAGTPGDLVKDNIVFHNFTDDESWVVHIDPQGFKLLRSKSNPLLYMYELRMVCLRPANMPSNSARGAAVRSLGISPNIQGSSSGDPLTAAQAHLNAALNLTRGRPASALASFISPINPLGGGKVKQFGNTVQSVQPRLMTMSVEPSITFEPFQAQVSQLTKETNRMLREGDIQSVNLILPKGSLTRYAIELKNTKYNELSVALQIILGELYSLSQNLVEGVSERMTRFDLDRLRDNLSWIAEKLAKLPDPDYDIVEEIRTLDDVVLEIMDSHLYNADVLSEIEDVRRSWGDSR